ncbi:hypothetical protein BDZ85DRAFT_260985 [Elsinoe ampelina]|uniref:Integral membrane protein n=1 Tax=Elsinoe ampelina TaxID=302913 RepID=A0A6A6GG69_9PEZI|nr:hypothetical protein BDZ85DRAFT_260985 [Elsinoe ampelina]
MTTPQRVITVRRLQTTMAASYAGMGAWCLLFPSTVLSLSLRPAFRTTHPTVILLMRCFGAQAATAGLLLGTAQMTSFSFKAFSLAMVPYIAGFNAWAVLGGGREMFTPWIWMDVIGNLFFMGGSWWAGEVLGGVEKAQGGKAN